MDSSCQNTAGHLFGQERQGEVDFSTFLGCIISEDQCTLLGLVIYIFIHICLYEISLLFFIWLANFQSSYLVKTKLISLIDAGLAINSAYPLVLRAKRRADLIISFDFSSGDPFEVHMWLWLWRPSFGGIGLGTAEMHYNHCQSNFQRSIWTDSVRLVRWPSHCLGFFSRRLAETDTFRTWAILSVLLTGVVW